MNFELHTDIYKYSLIKFKKKCIFVKNKNFFKLLKFANKSLSHSFPSFYLPKHNNIHT